MQALWTDLPWSGSLVSSVYFQAFFDLRYTQDKKSLGLLVVSDLAGEVLISITLSIQMWSSTCLLFPGYKKQGTLYCLCYCCGWHFTPLSLKESHYFGMVHFKFYGIKEKFISIFVCSSLVCNPDYKGSLGSEMSEAWVRTIKIIQRELKDLSEVDECPIKPKQHKCWFLCPTLNAMIQCLSLWSFWSCSMKQGNSQH